MINEGVNLKILHISTFDERNDHRLLISPFQINYQKVLLEMVTMLSILVIETFTKNIN